MDEIAVLLDVPTLAAEQTQSLHPVAKLGRYEDPRYGKFSITRADVASWQKNLRGLQGGRIPIDYDHLADTPGGSTKAAGWITELQLMTGQRLAELVPAYADRVDLQGEYAVATIDWTPEGADSVRAGYWLYVSPTFSSRYTDEQERDQGPTLVGTALTNRPFLRRGMPAIALTAAPVEKGLPAAVEVPADDPPARRDSRGTMPDLNQKLAKALGLKDDATDEEIVTAATEAAARPVKLEAAAGDVKTLAEAAAAEGLVLLSTDDHQTLVDGAKAGEQSAEKLRKLEFDNAFAKALREGRMTSDKETREKWEGRYKTGGWGPEVTLEALAELPKIVNLKAAGDGAAPTTEDAPEGADPDRHELHVRATQLAAEKNITLVEAAVLAEKELNADAA